jgi:type IV secretion system protein VirB6
MDIHVFSIIGGTIESSLVEPAQNIAMSLSGYLIPFVAGGLTIWIMVYALATVRGAVQMPVTDFSWRVVKISLILFFGIGGGIFQSDAHGFYSALSNVIYTAISTSSGGSCPIPVSDPMGIYGALDCSISNIFSPIIGSTVKIGKLIRPEDASLLDVATNFVVCFIPLILYGLFLFIALVLAIGLIAYTGFEVISLRFTVALAFALSPIFIYSLAFEPIKGLFSNWLNFVIKSVILQACFVAFIGVAFGAIGNLTDAMFEFSVTDLVGMVIACAICLLGFCIMIAIFIFVAARLPSFASELSGGGATGAGLGTLLAAKASRQLGKWTGGKLGSMGNRQGGQMSQG